MQYHPEIKAAELLERISAGEELNLVDVREVIEFHTYNIGGSNIPLSKLTGAINGLPYNKNDEIIVICKIGLRSETAQLMLQQQGYSNVRNLHGGLLSIQKIKQ